MWGAVVPSVVLVVLASINVEGKLFLWIKEHANGEVLDE